MRCIIIEDQPPAQRILKKYIEDAGDLELRAVFPDALRAMEYLKTEAVELIFLDIHLPRLSGLQFLKAIPKPPHVILTTAFPDYALESYEFNVVDYLLKPFSFERFLKAVSKVPVDKPAWEDPREIFIKSGYEFIRISLDELLYLQSDGDYTDLVLLQKRHLSSEPLRYWEEKLVNLGFVRVHKSYMVHLAMIEKISGNRIYLRGGMEVPIGRAYKEGFWRGIGGESNFKSS